MQRQRDEWLESQLSRALMSGDWYLKDDESSVGVLDLRTTGDKASGVFFRLYYPADDEHAHGSEPVRWWYRGLAYAGESYLHAASGQTILPFTMPFFNHRGLAFQVASLFIHLFTNILPQNWSSVPLLAPGARCKTLQGKNDGDKLPLVVWSHGLTGSGEEHAILATRLAQAGFVVACVHHQDGSSHRCLAPVRVAEAVAAAGRGSLGDLWGSEEDTPAGQLQELWYGEQVAFAKGREGQIVQREREYWEVRRALANECAGSAEERKRLGVGVTPEILQTLEEHTKAASSTLAKLGIAAAVDTSLAVCGGFSYGRATAALSAVRRGRGPAAWAAAVCMDAWFSINGGENKRDLTRWMPFPAAAHGREEGLGMPSLFLGSNEFQGCEFALSLCVSVSVSLCVCV